MFTLKHLLSIPLLLSSFWINPVFSDTPQSEEQKSATCSGCHGVKGKSNNSQWPNLAAQKPNYLVTQLKAFKSGNRNNAIMQGIAASLNDEDITGLATYFSNLPAVTANNGDPSQAKAGSGKAAMCMGCHGPMAEGTGLAPRLAGQNSEYLAIQLANFQQGIRKSGPMQAVAGNLSDTDINELSAYFSSLQ